MWTCRTALAEVLNVQGSGVGQQCPCESELSREVLEIHPVEGLHTMEGGEKGEQPVFRKS